MPRSSGAKKTSGTEAVENPKTYLQSLRSLFSPIRAYPGLNDQIRVVAVVEAAKSTNIESCTKIGHLNAPFWCFFLYTHRLPYSQASQLIARVANDEGLFAVIG